MEVAVSKGQGLGRPLQYDSTLHMDHVLTLLLVFLPARAGPPPLVATDLWSGLA